MSRIAKYPVDLPKGVEADIKQDQITVKGPLGSLTQALTGDVTVALDNGKLTFVAANETRHANAMAVRLAATIEDSASARLAWLPQANEVFAVMNKALAGRLQAAGAAFYDWHRPHGFDGHIGKDEALYRFVTNFATTIDEIDRFGALIVE